MAAIAQEVSVFGDAIAYFNEAARVLDLDGGIRSLLTKPQRQIIFSLPFVRMPASSKSSPAIACSTASLAGPRKAASATIPA